MWSLLLKEGRGEDGKERRGREGSLPYEEKEKSTPI